MPPVVAENTALIVVAIGLIKTNMLYTEDLPKEHPDLPISKSEKIDEYEALAGNVRIDRMEVVGGDDLYFVSHCLACGEAEGEYYTTKGAAYLKFEILKGKLIRV